MKVLPIAKLSLEFEGGRRLEFNVDAITNIILTKENTILGKEEPHSLLSIDLKVRDSDITEPEALRGSTPGLLEGKV